MFLDYILWAEHLFYASWKCREMLALCDAVVYHHFQRHVHHLHWLSYFRPDGSPTVLCRTVDSVRGGSWPQVSMGPAPWQCSNPQFYIANPQLDGERDQSCLNFPFISGFLQVKGIKGSFKNVFGNFVLKDSYNAFAKELGQNHKSIKIRGHVFKSDYSFVLVWN